MTRFFVGARGRSFTMRGTRKVPNPVGPSARLTAKLRTKLKTKTQTQLMQKRKNKSQQSKPIQNPGNIITQSFFKSYRPPKFSALVRKNASSPNYEIINAPQTFEALGGFQGYHFQPLMQRSNFDRILAAMPAQAPAGNATRRFLVERVQMNIVYTNASSASCTLDLYDVAVKQDSDLSPLTAYTAGLNMSAIPTSAVSPQILGAKLWHSSQFKEFFKVIRTTHVNLAAGASHKHNVSLSPNVIMKEQRIRENVNYKGITYITVAFVKGVPVCDNNAVPRLVSTAPIQIDVVAEQNTKYRWVSDVDTDLYFTNNMVTLANPENMNVFEGAALPVTKAA